jgi:hypothetical protein
MRSRFLMVGLLVFAAGCGSSKFVPVSGRVTLGGQPLVNATVIFQPQSKELNPGPGSRGKTDGDGRFQLRLQTGQGDGALIGPHNVSITAYEGDDSIPSSGSDMKFRKRIYPLDSNTKLTFEVPPGGTTAADFDLPAPP